MEVVKNPINISFFIFFWVMTACTPSDALLDEYKKITNTTWHRDSSVVFNTLIEDTSSMHLIIMRIRYNKDYNLSNIYLHREVSSEEGLAYQDTINLLLFDARGKMTGDGISNTREHEIPLGPSAVKFSKRTYYNFKVKHLMRDSLLPGIEHIGLKIEAIKP